MPQNPQELDSAKQIADSFIELLHEDDQWVARHFPGDSYELANEYGVFFPFWECLFATFRRLGREMWDRMVQAFFGSDINAYDPTKCCLADRRMFDRVAAGERDLHHGSFKLIDEFCHLKYRDGKYLITAMEWSRDRRTMNTVVSVEVSETIIREIICDLSVYPGKYLRMSYVCDLYVLNNQIVLGDYIWEDTPDDHPGKMRGVPLDLVEDCSVNQTEHQGQQRNDDVSSNSDDFDWYPQDDYTHW